MSIWVRDSFPDLRFHSISCSLLFWCIYSLFLGPMYNPTRGPEVTVDCVTYLLFRFEYFLLNNTLSLSAGCSMLSLVTILFTLIELILLFCWPFLLALSSWPSTDETTINKKDNKQKSPLLRRELINMIHVKYLLMLLLQFSQKHFSKYCKLSFAFRFKSFKHDVFYVGPRRLKFLASRYSLLCSKRTINCYTNTHRMCTTSQRCKMEHQTLISFLFFPPHFVSTLTVNHWTVFVIHLYSSFKFSDNLSMNTTFEKR